MPIMCDDCKCSNWLCKTCGDYGNDCDCNCCKCECQRQDSTALAVHIYKSDNPTNQQRSNTMINQPEPPLAIALTTEDLLRIDLENQRNITNGLRTTINEHRDNVRKLFTKVNDFIEQNDCDEDHDINLSELDDILNDVFKSRLVFEKVYEVQITYVVDATFEIRAKDENAAREIAEDIGVSRDPEFDHDEDPSECVIEQQRIGYVGRKVN